MHQPPNKDAAGLTSSTNPQLQRLFVTNPSWLATVPEWWQSTESTIAAVSESVARQLVAVVADRLLAFDSCEKLDPAVTRAVFEFRTKGTPSSCALQAVVDGTGTGPMAPQSCLLHLPKGPSIRSTGAPRCIVESLGG